MNLKKIKEQRTQQWANNRKIPRGWNRYRASTFLEVVGAKVDRTLQCQDLLLQPLSKEQRTKLEFDANDSLLDAYNYLGKLVELVEKNPKFLTDGRMP